MVKFGAKFMSDRVLITGGAGFIGSRLAKALSPRAERITVFDNLHTQVHGQHPLIPEFPDNVEFVQGDVTDKLQLRDATVRANPNLVFHLAAETGTGQSYDEPSRYSEVNVTGTANLIEAIRARPQTSESCRIVLAGSRAVYGEGAYTSDGSDLLVGPDRTVEALARGDFSPIAADGRSLTPVPTPETLETAPASVYAATKLMQEFLLSQCAAEDDYETVILRFQNVYGPGQSLRNPYTGVLSIFANQIMNGKTLNIFEDGEIVRDFIYVDDVVDALCVAGHIKNAPSGPINIGSGYPATILETARILLSELGEQPDKLRISGDFRPGDIRYAVADVTRARNDLNWHAKTDLKDGLFALAKWAKEGFVAEAKQY